MVLNVNSSSLSPLSAHHQNLIETLFFNMIPSAPGRIPYRFAWSSLEDPRDPQLVTEWRLEKKQDTHGLRSHALHCLLTVCCVHKVSPRHIPKDAICCWNPCPLPNRSDFPLGVQVVLSKLTPGPTPPLQKWCRLFNSTLRPHSESFWVGRASDATKPEDLWCFCWTDGTRQEKEGGNKVGSKRIEGDAKTGNERGRWEKALKDREK